MEVWVPWAPESNPAYGFEGHGGPPLAVAHLGPPWQGPPIENRKKWVFFDSHIFEGGPQEGPGPGPGLEGPREALLAEGPRGPQVPRPSTWEQKKVGLMGPRVRGLPGVSGP